MRRGKAGRKRTSSLKSESETDGLDRGNILWLPWKKKWRKKGVTAALSDFFTPAGLNERSSNLFKGSNFTVITLSLQRPFRTLSNNAGCIEGPKNLNLLSNT